MHAPVTDPGHELVHFLQGSASCQIGEENHRLETGDSLLIEASHPHLCRNDGRGSATLILVRERDPHAAQERSPHLEF